MSSAYAAPPPGAFDPEWRGGAFADAAGPPGRRDLSEIPETLRGPLIRGAHPIVSRQAALAAGASARTIDSLVRTGVLERLCRGWYAVPDPSRTAEQRHAILVSARLAGRRTAMAASHHSALVLAGLPVHGADLATVHLTSPSARSTKHQPGLIIHTAPPPGSLTRSGTVTTACALVQVGLSNGPRSFVVSADAALRAGTTTVDALEGTAAAYAGRVGVGEVRASLPRVTRLSESVGESLLRCDLLDLGWDVVPQVEVIAGGRRYRLDLLVRGTRVGVEFDGVGKYDTGGRAFRAEKAREEALRAAGFTLVRFMWQDLGRLEEINARMRAAVRRAGA